MAKIQDKPKKEPYDWETRPFTEDRIRDGMICELVFGWIWRERIVQKDKPELGSRKVLHPPDNDPDGWEPCNYAPDWFVPAKPETSPFLDWDRGCTLRSTVPNRDWEVVRSGIPHFSTKAGDDYLVLGKIRKIFSAEWQADFEQALVDIWAERTGMAAVCNLRYEAGDYAKAAIEVYRKNQPDHPAFDPKRVYTRTPGED